MKFTFSILILLLSCGTQTSWSADPDSMLDTHSSNTNQKWSAIPVFTVGDKINDYIAPGRLDGIGVFATQNNTARLLVNHEIKANHAYPYKLSNGTELTGARISYFDIHKVTGKNQFQIIDAGLAYKSIIDREGNRVSHAQQINEEDIQTYNLKKGLAKFCSGRSIKANTLGFVDDVFFAGEEISVHRHPHGGTMWVLDVKNKSLHAAPDLGRGAWENVTPIDTSNANTIALLIGDDTAPAPLYLYQGKKSAVSAQNGGFLSRNGLSGGQLYCWKSNTGDSSPETFNNTGSTLAGSFISLDNRNLKQAGSDGYDKQGYPDSDTLRQTAFNKGCFQFSRLEDLHNDPSTPGRAVFADTGQGLIHPANDWGSIHIIDIRFDHHFRPETGPLKADIHIAYDSDDADNRDEGIRSPDNLTWADNGMIYVQEDRASELNTFAANGIEASIWQLNPETHNAQRIAVINREAIYPIDAKDKKAGELGTWETSGLLDVSQYFDTSADETLLISAVQAHKVKGGSTIGGKNELVEAGQLIFLTNKPAKQD